MNKLLISMLFVLVLAFMPAPAEAKPHQLSWSWPTTDCDSLILASSDLIESELIYAVSSMPMPSDTTGSCDATADPGAPAGATVVPISISETSAVLNLKPGQTYYARIRVSAYVAGNWSSWSTELQFTVPYGRPNKVILADGLIRYESTMMTTTVLKFGV